MILKIVLLFGYYYFLLVKFILIKYILKNAKRCQLPLLFI